MLLWDPIQSTLFVLIRYAFDPKYVLLGRIQDWIKNRDLVAATLPYANRNKTIISIIYIYLNMYLDIFLCSPK